MLQAKTQDSIPESGLGPQNSQWRRWVETSITNMKRGLVAFKADIANSFKAISSSLELLSRQVLDNRSYPVLSSGTYTFHPYPTFPPPPQTGGSVTFTATGTQVLVTLSLTGTMTTAANTFFWVYTVKIPGVLTPVLVSDANPKRGNALYVGDYTMGGISNKPTTQSLSFLIDIPAPGQYTITTQFQAEGNGSETAILGVTSALMELRNL